MKTVLIIDDDPSVCESLEAILSLSYTVITCHSVSDATAIVSDATKQIDLIIVDFQIHNESGVDFYTTQIVNQNRSIPAILISGFLISQLYTPGQLAHLENTFVKIVEKPIDLFAFAHQVRTLL